MSRQTKADQDVLMSDLQDVLADTETLLRDVGNDASEMTQDLRQKIAANLQGVKAKLIETGEMVSEKSRYAAKATDDYVRENPWQSIGAAAGVGFLLGLLVSRR